MPPRCSFLGVRERDLASGLDVIVLACREAGCDAPAWEARVAPFAGANLYSLIARGEQLLEQPESLASLAVSAAGTPIMFPSPNRVRDGAFVFEGQRFSFEPNSGPHFIHGLVRRCPWQASVPRSGADDAAVTAWIDWDQRQPDFVRFPVVHRMTVTYTLTRRRLRIGYAVDNLSQRRLPFGFGLHPWFRIPGARRDVVMRIPADARMENEDKLPTGRLVPVAGTRFDLSQPTSLEGLDLDDVYVGLSPSAAPWFEWREHGLRLDLGGSPEFTHLVVYTPPGWNVFCVENQTCSTDAHNLAARGFEREAHLQVVEPGDSARAEVEWRLTWLFDTDADAAPGSYQQITDR